MTTPYEIAESLVKKTDKSTPDFRGIVAVDDAQNLILIATTGDCKSVDLFINGYSHDDNGIECSTSLDVGLYEMKFYPWSSESYEGDYDCGINATVIRQIGETPKEFRLKP